MTSNKSIILCVFLLAVTVAIAVSMRLKPDRQSAISLSEIQQANNSQVSVDDAVKTGSNTIVSNSTTDIGVKTGEQASNFGQSKLEFEPAVTHENLSHTNNTLYTKDENLVDTVLDYEMDFEQFNTNMAYSITSKDYSAFQDFALMMQDSYLVKKPCVECRQLFVDILKDPSADLEFRVVSIEALSGLENYESSQQLVGEFISQLISSNESSYDPDSVTLIHELKNTLLDSGNDFNIKALVDYYIGKTDYLIDNPLSFVEAESRVLIEQEISSLLNEHYDRELIATVLRDAFYENPQDHAQSQLMNLSYPELYVELALVAQQSGLTNHRDFYINHIYQNLSPDNAIRAMFELSSKNLVTPENLYQRTNEWAQQNIGSYSDSYDEIFLNYHDNTDRSMKSVAIALAGNLYDENKAKSILNEALGVETDPFIRQMIIGELSRLNDTEQS